MKLATPQLAYGISVGDILPFLAIYGLCMLKE